MFSFYLVKNSGFVKANSNIKFSYYLYYIKNLQHILVYIAGLVIVLHSLLPHQHHGELTFDEHEIQHKEADSLLDYIKLIFHEDMGEAHLEHVVVGQCLNLDLDSDFHISDDFYFVVLMSYSDDVVKSQSNGNDFIYVDDHAHRRFDASTHLRGPPALI